MPVSHHICVENGKTLESNDLYRCITAEVESSNVVGYQKITLQPGYNAIAAQFVPTGASAITDILDVADCTVLPTIDVDTETGEGYARLQSWDPNGGYTSYEWTGTGVAAAWDWEGIDNKWMTSGCEEIAQVAPANGEGFWLWLDPSEVNENITLTVKGQVPDDATVTLPLVAGYNLIANPFSMAIDIQDIAFSNLPTIDADTETGEGYARLQTWDPNGGYTTYEWTGDGIAAAWDWEGIDNKWMTSGCEEIAEDVVIPAGASFWLWLDPAYAGLANNVSVTFTNPTK